MVCITFSHTFWRFKMSKMKNFFYTLLISSSLPHNREEDENIITFPHACWNEIKHLCLTYNTSWEFEKALDHPMTMISVITARIIGRNFKPQPKFLNWNMLKKIFQNVIYCIPSIMLCGQFKDMIWNFLMKFCSTWFAWIIRIQSYYVLSGI